MAHHRQLEAEATAAYSAGRFDEAALLFRRMAAAALEVGERAMWFEAFVWAAISTRLVGDLRKALGLLIEARQSEPQHAPPYLGWIVRKQLFWISLDINPQRRTLEHLLDELRTHAREHGVPAAEFLVLEGDLLELHGDWQGRLERCESAWQAYDDEQTSLKSDLGSGAAVCCIELGRFAECREWLAEAAAASTSAEFVQHVAERLARIETCLALAECQRCDVIESTLRRYIDRAMGMQSTRREDRVRELVARVHLLNPQKGDPAKSLHPSYMELCRLPRCRQSVHLLYRAHRVHLDYRIACLRYAVGVPPVDDLYYNRPQGSPERSPTDGAPLRLRRARASLRSTLRWARHLDELIECDWRQREIEARRERIDELATYIDTPSTR